jgi:O-antigen/teichoic acid export membrane protein
LKPFQSNGVFFPIATGKGLYQAAVRGAGAAITGQASNFIVGIGSIVILARLLTPADFGVVTMVTTFSLLFRSFGLNGFTELIMQREEITHPLASNLFWINLGIGAILAGVFACSGKLLALFYHNVAVVKVAAGMSLTIAVSCAGYIHLGLLQRAMHFRSIAIINFAGQALQVIVSILFAMLGWHYWALVWGSLTQAAVTTAGGWLVCRWIPRWPGRVPGTGSSCKFAMNVYSRCAFSYLTTNTDNLLVGWRFGARSLGFYKKAYDLFVLPETQLLAPMSAVVVSTLSRVSHDRELFQRYFLRTISVLALVGMGVGADIALVGQDLFRILLGPGWEEAGRIFALFGPGIGVMLLYGTHGWIHLSIGRPERWFRWGVVEFVCTTGLFLLALPLGPAGIALAWTASFFLLMFPGFWYAGQPIGLGLKPIFAVIWKFMAASAGAGCATVLLIRAIPHSATRLGVSGAFVNLVSVSAAFLVLYFGGVIALHRGMKPIHESLSLIHDLLPVGGIRSASPEAVEMENAPAISALRQAVGSQEGFAMVSGDAESKR